MIAYERKLDANSILIKIPLATDKYWEVNYVLVQTTGGIVQECKPDYYFIYSNRCKPLGFEYDPHHKHFITCDLIGEYPIGVGSRLSLELFTLRHIIDCEKLFISWYKLKYVEYYLISDVINYIYKKMI